MVHSHNKVTFAALNLIGAALSPRVMVATFRLCMVVLKVMTDRLKWVMTRLLLERTTEPITEAGQWNHRHARWHQIVASYNFNIVYRAGKMSDKPDALSRRHNHADIPNPAQTMIAAEQFLGFRVETEIDLISAIQEGQEEDESLSTLISSTKAKESLPPSVQKQFRKYKWEEGLIWYED
ncbi:hypothetical protein FRC10_008302 [Ceratobasidium sp. 414]|nr:hypothetical protein FRC10_008302 [Ceratobasidium sp. 414]